MTTTQEPITMTVTSSKRVKVPTILQQAATECGAASLGMVLAHYGLWKSLDELRHDLGVDRDGASAQAIVDGGTAFGLDSSGSRVATADLGKVSTPAILWWKRGHFLVFEGASHGLIHINDPARGRVSLPIEEFDLGYSGIALEFKRNDSFVKGGHKFSTTSSLWSRLKNSKKGVTFAIYAGILATLLGLLIAPFSQVFVNDALGNSRRDILPGLMVALLVVGFLRSGLNLLQYGVISRLQAKFSLVGTASLLERMVRLPMLFYLERAVGDVSQRVGYNSQVAMLLANQMASAGIAMLALVGYALLLLYYNLTIGALVLIITGFNVVVLRLVMNRRTTMQGRILRRQNDLRGLTTAAIRNIETLKSTGQEDQTFASLSGMQTDYISATAALVPSSALLAALPIALMSLTNATILVVGGFFIANGSLSFGALLAIQALALSIGQPVQVLMSTGGQLQVVTSSLQALDDVLKNPLSHRFERPQIVEGDPVPSFSGHLEMRNVSYAYGEKAPLLLDNFNLELKPGSRVALVGVSGAGKTTIGNLAAGLLEPRSGEILFDGIPLSGYPEGAIEQRLSKVDQNVVLFSGTVAENVSLWDRSISYDQIASALDDAQVLPDVLARQGALDCTVEEDGRNFSGGQCQRIEIARALIRNPSLIVLDEATSALDDVTEVLVGNSIRRRGVASLIIAHRLSTIRDADEIIVLGRGGKVLERGSHDELMAAGGIYEQMVAEAGEGGDVGS
jgi:NHLM bacteriocin system ABC transporter peptidase/ATP-binding protein